MEDDGAVRAYLGAGPVVELMLLWRQGTIGEAVALQRATEPRVVDGIGPSELSALSDRCVRWCYQGHWQDAVLLHRLLLAIFGARPDRFGPCLRDLAADQLRTATSALWDRADHALYASALSFGVRAWETLDDDSSLSEIANLLGILHLDPYAASRAPDDIKRWWREAEKTRDESKLASTLPMPLKAMETARLWLERALVHAEGIARLEILKALLQVIYSMPLFGGAVDDKRARALLSQTTPLLPLAGHRDDILSYLRRVAASLGLELPTHSIQSPVETDWEARVQVQGIELVTDTLIAMLKAETPQEAPGLALAMRVESIFTAAPEPQRLAFERQVVRLLIGSPIEPPRLQTSRANTLKRIATGTRNAAWWSELLRTLGWIPAMVAQEREGEAKVQLDALCKAAPDFVETWFAAIGLLRAELSVGQAVNQFRQEEFDNAVVSYYDAWAFYLRGRYFRMAIDIMSRISDLLPRASARTATAICELVREQPAPWIAEVNDDWHAACARLVEAATHPLEADPTADGWFALARLGKGPAFASQVLTQERYDWKADPDATRFLSEIRALDDSSVQAQPRMEAGELFEHVLGSHRADPRAQGGGTVGEQRDNLARHLDLHVRRALAGMSAQEGERFSYTAVQERLPDDAVLLDLFFPAHAKSYGYCLAFTKESVGIFVVVVNDQLLHEVAMGGDTADHWTSHAGMTVAATRRAILQEPAPGQKQTADCTAALQAATRLFLGNAADWLEEQRAAGKRHLIVVPDGATHFFPFHLAGVDGRTFADDWTVTYLPSIDLLRRSLRDEKSRSGAAVVGLGYKDNPAGLPPLEWAPREAAAVAKALGAIPIREEDATPARVLLAMAQVRYLHVACHGDHDVVASTLQCLRLAASDGQNGQLLNLDVMALDLRGLSVLGLSACETALGRIDAAGNLLSISASALAGGASCVVGTLWPAADDASAVFFAVLFALLAAGKTRRDAFRVAQLETRKRFPMYRDWGAFYFSGDW